MFPFLLGIYLEVEYAEIIIIIIIATIIIVVVILIKSCLDSFGTHFGELTLLMVSASSTQHSCTHVHLELSWSCTSNDIGFCV